VLPPASSVAGRRSRSGGRIAGDQCLLDLSIEFLEFAEKFVVPRIELLQNFRTIEFGHGQGADRVSWCGEGKGICRAALLRVAAPEGSAIAMGAALVVVGESDDRQGKSDPDQSSTACVLAPEIRL
jgi:hypothetical protein